MGNKCFKLASCNCNCRKFCNHQECVLECSPNCYEGHHCNDCEHHNNTDVDPDVEFTVYSDVEPEVDTVVEPEVDPVVEPVVEPEVDPVVEPVVEPEVEPVVEPEVEPVVEPEVDPAVEPEVEPVVEPEAEPSVDKEVKPVAKPEVKPDVKQIIKQALMIGINYTGQQGELRGCINDVENLKVFLKDKYMPEDRMILMTDHHKEDLYPSKANIMNQLQKLVKLANNNLDKEVHLFVSYSGHGSYQRDSGANRDEEDGRDEMLCPIDYAQNGFIIDDDLKSQFVDKLPSNVKCVILVDACHSGTILDLKYNYKVDLQDRYSAYKKLADSNCDIVMISGCNDLQTSADAYLKDDVEQKLEYQGAMTKSLLAAYKEGISYKALVTNMRTWLKSNRFTQLPQLSSGKPIDVNKSYLLQEFKL